MLRKNRIGLFVLLLATGFISVGEASARAETEVRPGPETGALPGLGQPEAEGADNGAAVETCAAGKPNCVTAPPWWYCIHGQVVIPRACDPDVPDTECKVPEPTLPDSPGRKA